MDEKKKYEKRHVIWPPNWHVVLRETRDWPGREGKNEQMTLTQLGATALDLIVAFWQFFHHDRRTVINIHGKCNSEK